ncbi:hypothetical protein GCM10009416_14550 [Craurococcus roseus]|uniref:Uncharacterized protein n=1 Tax=Craurococcus roseus TaxID=77585 RepID=A0ABP3PW35_9PROT
MYAMVRRYAGKGGLMDRLAPQVQDGLVPLLKAAPGGKATSGAFEVLWGTRSRRRSAARGDRRMHARRARAGTPTLSPCGEQASPT